MYGLIHTALRDMVTTEYSPVTWEKIVTESDVPTDAFLTMRSYNDNVTNALIEAASNVLQTPVDDCLFAFGEYWIKTFAPRDYEAVLRNAGNATLEFLRNLDDMHDRISTVFCDFVPPSFRIEIMDETRALVHYSSSRQGLTPFVLGILNGLGPRFGESVSIVSVETRLSEEGEQSTIAMELG